MVCEHLATVCTNNDSTYAGALVTKEDCIRCSLDNKGRYCNCEEPTTRNIASNRCLKCGKIIKVKKK